MDSGLNSPEWSFVLKAVSASFDGVVVSKEGNLVMAHTNGLSNEIIMTLNATDGDLISAFEYSGTSRGHQKTRRTLLLRKNSDGTSTAIVGVQRAAATVD